MSTVRSGGHAYVQYGKETTWKTFPTITRAFGYNQVVNGLQFQNQALKLASLGQGVYESSAFANYKGAFSMEWVLSNPWWLDQIYGAGSHTGSAPTTHVYPDQADAHFQHMPVDLSSFGLEVGVDQVSTDTVFQYAGCIFNSVNLACRVNDFVQMRAQCQYAKLPVVATTLDSTVATEDVAFPYTFIHGTLDISTVVGVATIQSIELNQNLNSQLLWGFGNLEATDNYRGVLEVTGKVNCKFADATLYNFVKAAAEPATNTMKLKFTNGGVGAAEKSLQFDGTGLILDMHSFPTIKVGEAIFQDIAYTVRIPKWTAINAITTAP